MELITNRRSILRWTALMAAAATLSACHTTWHVPPGQVRRQTTPAATGTAPGQAKKK
jgi:hypothetical protein